MKLEMIFYILAYNFITFLITLGVFFYLIRKNQKLILENSIYKDNETFLEVINHDKNIEKLYGNAFHIKEFNFLIKDKIINENIEEYVYVVLDIDDFKMVNKLHGVKMGDNILAYISNEIKTVINQEREFFTRIESDVFAILLLKNDAGVCYDDKIDTIKNSILDFGGSNISLIPSIGVYLIPNNKVELMHISTNAYLAKKLVKGNSKKFIYSYGDKLTNDLIKEKKLFLDFKKDLESKRFKLYFQIQKNIKTQKDIGAEVLVRWDNELRGLLTPFHFIDYLEKKGDIFLLDYYVFEETCRMIGEWIKDEEVTIDFKNFRFSVNFSRITFLRDGMVNKLEEIISKYKTDPSMLEIEITESVFEGQPEKTTQVVDQLKRNGFRIAIDDFGSGYSSLNVLKDADISTLKLDRIFLLNNGVNQKRTEEIISNVIKLGSKIGLNVIAEGIEKETQAKLLDKLNCPIGQGYLFSLPLNKEEFENVFLKRGDNKKKKNHKDIN